MTFTSKENFRDGDTWLSGGTPLGQPAPAASIGRNPANNPEGYPISEIKSFVQAHPETAATALQNEQNRPSGARASLITWLQEFISANPT